MGKKKQILFLYFLPIVLVSLFYQYIFQPHNVEKITKYFFNKYTAGVLDLKIKKASLFYGFQIEECTLKLKSNLQEVLYFKEARISTFLPALLVGEVSLRNVYVKDLRLHINRVKGRWDWGQIFNPKYIDPKKEVFDPFLYVAIESIPMFIPIRLHANIEIINASYYMEMDSKHFPSDDLHKDYIFGLKVEGFDAHFSILTKTFRKLPLSIDMANIFETVIFAINPKQTVNVSYRMNSEIKVFPNIKFFIYKDIHKGILDFQSRLIFDIKNAKMISQKNVKNFDLKILYDVAFETKSERLLINKFILYNKQSDISPITNLSFNAVAYNFDKNYRSLELNLSKSTINLDIIGNLITDLVNFKTKPLGGIIEVDKLQLFGELDKLSLQSKIEAKNFLYLSNSNSQRVKYFNIELLALTNFYKILPISQKPENYNKDEVLAFYMFRKLLLKKFELEHDKISLNATAEILPEKGVEAKILLKHCYLNYFFDNKLYGDLNGNLILNSTNNFNKITFKLDGTLNQFSYITDRSKSQNVYLGINSKGQMNTLKNFILTFDFLDINVHNQNGRPFGNLNVLNSSLTLGSNIFEAKLGKSKLKINGEELYNNFPNYIKNKIKYTKLYFKNRGEKQLEFTTPSLLIYKTQNETTLKGLGLIKIPALNLDDVDFKYNMNFTPSSINFHEAKFVALKGSINANLIGKIIKRKEWESNLSFNLNGYSKNLVRIHENFSFQGAFNFKMKLDEKWMEYAINLKHLNLEFHSGICENLNNFDCKTFYFNDLFLDNFIIKHLKKPNYPSQKIAEKELDEFRSKSNTNYKYNFGIASVSSSHTPRGEYQTGKSRWHYLGKPNSKDYGFKASLIYKNNNLIIPYLEVKLFRNEYISKKNKTIKWIENGNIIAKDSLFDFYDLSPKNINSKFHIKIWKLNLEPYLPESRRDYNGVVSADIKARINGFDKNFYANSNGTIYLHNLSPEFGGFITRLFMPAQLVAFMVRSFLEIPTIKVTLKEGLFYTQVQVQRARFIPGVFFSSAQEQIKQERIPLNQFFKVFNSEIKSFSSTIEQYKNINVKVKNE